jgi:spore germination protein KA
VLTEGKETSQPAQKRTAADQSPLKVPSDMKLCEKKVKNIFHESSDVVIHRFPTVLGEAMIVYIDGLADKDLMDRDIIEPLKSENFDGDVPKAIRVTSLQRIADMNAISGQVLDGNVAIFFEGQDKAVITDLKHWSQRAVEPPDSEAVIRGPKEGFNESLRNNTSMLRRKIKSPALVFESSSLGRQTNTRIAIAYVKGVVNEEVLQELKTRLARIDTGAILESGYIEEYIADHPLSVVPSVGLSQKPDVVAAKLLEGRVAVFCDGTPHVLTVPHLFVEDLQTGEDYYNRTAISSVLRAIRFIALGISLLLPGLFVAVVNFNQEMIPTVFLITLAAAREQIPLPVAFELFFMLLMFELLRESGTRLPRPIGSAISIVGALIIGETAVKAGIVGAPAVIVLALTAVSSFINPTLTEFMTVYRFFFWLLGSAIGIVGISAGLVVMLTHVVSSTSFGVPVLSSFSRQEMKDTFIRMPLRSMRFRPRSVGSENKKRHNSP